MRQGGSPSSESSRAPPSLLIIVIISFIKKHVIKSDATLYCTPLFIFPGTILNNAVIASPVTAPGGTVYGTFLFGSHFAN